MFLLDKKLENIYCYGVIAGDFLCSNTEGDRCFMLLSGKNIDLPGYSFRDIRHYVDNEGVMFYQPESDVGSLDWITSNGVACFGHPGVNAWVRYRFGDHSLSMFSCSKEKYWQISDFRNQEVICQFDINGELDLCYHGVGELAFFTNRLENKKKRISDTITAISMLDGNREWQTTLPKGFEVDPRREVLEAGNILVFSGKVFVDYPIVFFGKKMKPPPGGDMMPTLFALDKATGEFIWGGSLNAIPYWSDFRLSDCVDRETNKLHLLSSPGFSILDLRTGKYEKIDFFEKKEALELLSQSYSCPFQDLFFIYSRHPRKWALYCPKKREIVESGEGDWDELNGPPIVCGNQIVINTRKALRDYEYMNVTYVFEYES